MKKIVMATMMCIGLGVGNNAIAKDIAGNKGVDAMMEIMGDTCAIAGKVIMTDRLNGVSQQQAKESFQEKYMQEFDKRDSASMAVNLENVYILSNNPDISPEVVDSAIFTLVKRFSDYLIPAFFTAAWSMPEPSIRELQENQVETIDYFAQRMDIICQEQVYEAFQGFSDYNDSH